MRNGRPTKCRSCNGDVFFAETSPGKRMILNIEPDPVRGNVLTKNSIAIVLGLGQAERAREAGFALFLDHHATCPQAEAWRRA